MKKLFIAAFALTITIASNAQSGKSHNKSTCSAPADSAKAEKFVMMYKGKMMKIVDGTPSPMTESVKLDNGAKVNTDGSVNLPNGKKIKIKENEMVTMSGKMSMYKGKQLSFAINVLVLGKWQFIALAFFWIKITYT